MLGDIPVLPATLSAARHGAPLLIFLQKRGTVGRRTALPKKRNVVTLAGLSAALVIPPIFIDINQPFPRDMNVALSDALLVCPGIALIAEAALNPVPPAVLSLLTLRATALPVWNFVVVVFLDPSFRS